MTRQLKDVVSTLTAREQEARTALEKTSLPLGRAASPDLRLVASGLAPELENLLDDPSFRSLNSSQLVRWCAFYYETQNWSQLESFAAHLQAVDATVDEIVLSQVRLGWSFVLRGDRLQLEKTLSSIRRTVGDHPVGWQAMGQLAHLEAYFAYRYTRQAEKTRLEIEIAVATLRKSGDALALARALTFRSLIQKVSGSLSSALESIDEGLAVVSELGNRRLLASLLSQRLIMEMRSGYIRDAQNSLLVAKSVNRTARDPITSHSLLLLELILASICRRRSRALRALHVIRARRGVFDPFRAMIALEYEGVWFLGEDHPAEALGCFNAALEQFEAADYSSYELPELHLRRAEALNALDRYSEARAACDTALEMLDRPGEGLERGHVYRQRGLANHAMARPTDARADLDRAETELRRVGDRFELTRLLLDRAELFPRETVRALKDAEEAVTLAEQVGIDHLLQRARDVYDLAQMRFHELQRTRQVAQVFANDRPDIIAISENMQQVLARAVEFGAASQPVLITGETGSGKEIIAQTVHANSPRSTRDLISLNCAAVPESLIERELFGHVRGAFTGADRDREGIVDAAHKGTLFLDEIGELPLSMQSKLLRLLQNGSYRPVGATKEKRADIRIIAATHRNLFTMCRSGQFRDDLYYRIAGLRIAIPPLRDRVEDTVALANLFMEEQSQERGWHIWMDRDAWQLVKSFHWPGNVRQLQSVIRAACLIVGESSVIKVEHLRELLSEEFEHVEAERARTSLNYHENMQATERRLIRTALEQSNYCRKTAAQLLGIGRNTIYEKIKKLGLEPELPAKSDEA